MKDDYNYKVELIYESPRMLEVIESISFYKQIEEIEEENEVKIDILESKILNGGRVLVVLYIPYEKVIVDIASYFRTHKDIESYNIFTYKINISLSFSI